MYLQPAPLLCSVNSVRTSKMVCSIYVLHLFPWILMHLVNQDITCIVMPAPVYGDCFSTVALQLTQGLQHDITVCFSRRTLRVRVNHLISLCGWKRCI